MSVVNATNHWSRCPWVAVENEEPNTIAIYTDQADMLFFIYNPEGITGDDRALADYVIRSHNTKLQEQKGAIILEEDFSRKPDA